MTRVEWKVACAKLTATFGRNISDDTEESWFPHLAEWRPQAVADAIRELAMTEDRLPSLAKLMAVVRKQPNAWAGITRDDQVGGVPGCIAVVTSKNYQPCALFAGGTLPADIEVTEIEGDRQAVLAAIPPKPRSTLPLEDS